jgi:hypothetical protein
MDDEREQSEHEKAAEEMREFEKQDDLPSDLSAWPDGKAKFVTFGEQDDSAYGEGMTEKLGPAEVGRHEDGSVTISGEPVDDPDEHKAEPVRSGVVEQIEESKEAYRQLQKDDPALREVIESDDQKESDGPAAGA